MTAAPAAPLAIAASGLTVLGVSTGLDPGFLLAGIAGGWWALSYTPTPMPLGRRLGIAAVSALLGAWAGSWASPPAAAWLAYTYSDWWPAEAGAGPLGYLVSAVVGLLAHRQIGPLLMRRAARLDSQEGRP